MYDIYVERILVRENKINPLMIYDLNLSQSIIFAKKKKIAIKNKLKIFK